MAFSEELIVLVEREGPLVMNIVVLFAKGWTSCHQNLGGAEIN